MSMGKSTSSAWSSNIPTSVGQAVPSRSTTVGDGVDAGDPAPGEGVRSRCDDLRLAERPQLEADRGVGRAPAGACRRDASGVQQERLVVLVARKPPEGEQPLGALAVLAASADTIHAGVERLRGEGRRERALEVLARGPVDREHGAVVLAAADQQVVDLRGLQRRAHGREVVSHRLDPGDRIPHEREPSAVVHDVLATGEGRRGDCGRRMLRVGETRAQLLSWSPAGEGVTTGAAPLRMDLRRVALLSRREPAIELSWRF